MKEHFLLVFTHAVLTDNKGSFNVSSLHHVVDVFFSIKSSSCLFPWLQCKQLAANVARGTDMLAAL